MPTRDLSLSCLPSFNARRQFHTGHLRPAAMVLVHYPAHVAFLNPQSSLSDEVLSRYYAVAEAMNHWSSLRSSICWTTQLNIEP